MTQKRLSLSVLAVLLIAAVAAAPTTPAPASAPPGVNPQMWHPLSERLGIALRVEKGFGNAGSVLGTLWYRDGDRWRPVSWSSEPALAPARAVAGTTSGEMASPSIR